LLRNRAKFEEGKQAHVAKMAKMEAEMNAVFQIKVKEKEAKLKQSEDEVYWYYQRLS
jgi:septin 7